ncbi:YciI family protein [Luteipulveratus mongoliensis]|uniref:Transcription initiation protein n=1 Tax=Luteipulveratus mongoliensis TaxID=571913 RepID=A0A0K1JFE9_9MICO|nr:YciI family protein [Luteipulveratus mongoliensis]AKU15434.1 transcription initiation protein [Luteipulveratus mongoliensis]
MPQYLALTYTADVDWSEPERASEMADYRWFAAIHADQIKARAVLEPTNAATVVRVEGGRGGEVVTTEGAYAQTERALTGYYLIDADDLDAAVQIAADLPAAWTGAVEIRPVLSTY